MFMHHENFLSLQWPLKPSKPGRDRRLMSQLYPLYTLFSSTCPSVNITPSTLWGNIRVPRPDRGLHYPLRLLWHRRLVRPDGGSETALASPKRSPRWPCLGGETDGVVPLKAQNQPATRPPPPSTPPTPTPPHTRWIIHVPRRIRQRTFWGAGTADDGGI